MPAAIIALLTALLESGAFTALEGEIKNLIDSLGKSGLTKATAAQIHALAQSIHDQVVEAEGSSSP